MNIPQLRSKRVLIPVVAATSVLAIGGPVWAATSGDDLRGSERDRVADAALTAVGGGTAVDVESSDDRGEAYEVEVRTDDGREVDVDLDTDLTVVGQQADDRDGRDDDRDERDERGDDRDDRDERGDDDGRDRGERALGDAERAKAEKAALDAVGGGTVLDAEASDDRGEAYEVEVRDADGAEWDVELDSDFTVLHKDVDD